MLRGIVVVRASMHGCMLSFLFGGVLGAWGTKVDKILGHTPISALVPGDFKIALPIAKAHALAESIPSCADSQIPIGCMNGSTYIMMVGEANCTAADRQCGYGYCDYTNTSAAAAAATGQFDDSGSPCSPGSCPGFCRPPVTAVPRTDCGADDNTGAAAYLAAAGASYPDTPYVCAALGQMEYCDHFLYGMAIKYYCSTSCNAACPDSATGNVTLEIPANAPLSPLANTTLFLQECAAAVTAATCSDITSSMVLILSGGEEQVRIATETVAIDGGLNLPSFGSIGLSATSSGGILYGDPHLENLRGQRFDIHDGLHRLVHLPRGSSESDALLKIDAEAAVMGRDTCYSVFVREAKLSGKWIGDEVKVSLRSPAGQDAFGALMSGQSKKWLDWKTLISNATGADLKLPGSKSVKVTAGRREESEKLPGGESLVFQIGEENPIRMEAWSTHGSNELTNGNLVHFMNLKVDNLPKGSGGILGLDEYVRPAGSKCDLVQEEKDLLHYAEEDLSLLRINFPRFPWTISATAEVL